MSRPTRRSKSLAAEAAPADASRPTLVWIAYGLGILGAVVLVSSALFLAAGYFTTDDVTVGFSVPAIVLWSCFLAIGVGTWIWRRFGSRP